MLSNFHVGIVGAGLGGLCAAIRLEQAGIPYTVFDKNPDVGGTWFENTYPDLRVDVPNHFYSYSFRPNPDWSHFYARQHELFDYIASCAKEFGVLPHVRFGTEVRSATFDEGSGTWRVALRDAQGDSEVEVNALVSAVGMLNRPAVPDIEGLDTFAGPCFHSSRWDHDVELREQRVVVIGTGASVNAVRARGRARGRTRHHLPTIAPLGHAQPRLPPTGERRREVAVPQRAPLPGVVPGAAVLEQRRPHVPGVPRRPGVGRPGSPRSAGRTTRCAG